MRLGVPEIVRLGLTPDHMPALAALIARALASESVAGEVRAFRRRFEGLHYVRT